MRKSTQDHSDLEGAFVVDLLEKDEYASNLGHVAAVSDRQILAIRGDWHELTHFRLDVLEMSDCRGIEYVEQRAWYRVVLGIVSLIGAASVLGFLVFGGEPVDARTAPVVVVLVALISLGVRLVTSTRRHLLRFELPGEILDWRSTPINFESRTAAAIAVRDFARERGLLRQG
jgi:hypothetical protein